MQGRGLPKLTIYAELCHDAQREYAERVGIPENQIDWVQHEPSIQQEAEYDQ